MTGWRLAVRLAARQARRRPLRAALVAALVALPVAGVVAGGTVARATTVRPEQSERWLQGGADAVVVASGVPGGPPTAAAADGLAGSLPAGSRAVVSRARSELVRGAGGRLAHTELRDLDLSDPLVAGVRVVLDGRPPDRRGEVALSPAVLRAAGARVGDEVELTRSGVRARVTGVVVDPASLDAPVAIAVGTVEAASPDAQTRVYLDVPGGAVPARFPSPFVAEGGAYMEEGGGPSLVAVRLFGGVALVVAALVAAAAFAVGSRRHLRELGVLAASGAAPHHLARVMVAEGLVLGAAGAAAGVVAGLLGVAALGPHLDGIAGHLTGGPRLSAAEAAVAAVAGVGAAVVAAWAQARTAHWLPVLAALAGRRPVGRLPRSVPAAGTVLVALGVGLLVWVGALPFGADLWQFSVAGGVAVLLGATVLAPWIVAGVERSSRWARGSARVALRSLGRQRVRSAAVVSAVMAAAALAVAASSVLLGDDALRSRTHLPVLGPDQVAVEAYRTVDPARPESEPVVVSAAVEAVERLLPPGTVKAVRHRALGRPEPGSVGPAYPLLTVPGVSAFRARAGEPVPGVARIGDVWVASPELLDALGVSGVAVSSGGVQAVVVAPEAAGTVRATLTLGSTRRALDVAVVPGPEVSWGSVLVAPDRLDDLGLEPHLAGVLLRAPRPLTGAERGALDRLDANGLALLTPPGTTAWVTSERPPTRSGGVRVLVLGGALVFTLAVVVLGLALLAAEGRDEAALLRAVGASPRTSRRVRAVQGGTLAAVGGLLGVPTGFVPVAAYVAGTADRPVVFPTAAAFTVAVAIPAAVAVAVLAAGWFSPDRRVRPALLVED